MTEQEIAGLRRCLAPVIVSPDVDAFIALLNVERRFFDVLLDAEHRSHDAGITAAEAVVFIKAIPKIRLAANPPDWIAAMANHLADTCARMLDQLTAGARIQ